MKKLLITLPIKPEDITRMDEYLSWLRDAGFEIRFIPGTEAHSEEEMMELWKGIDAHIATSDKMTARAMDAADRLKIISRIGVGVETVDIPAATARKIVVANTPGAGAETVAEFTFALILALSRNIVMTDKMLHLGNWQRIHGYSLYRKTLGIIGLGAIGRQLAKLVSGFDMRVIAFDPYPDEAYAALHNITMCSLDDLLKLSDYISIHIPYNNSTKNMIGECELAMMKSTAQIVNTSRGGIINEQALYNALKEKIIFGAALDVHTVEPMTNMDNPLLTLNNIILTPHAAGSAYEGRNKVIEAVMNVIDFFNDKIPSGIRNPEVLKGLTQVKMRP
jgi:D-3-phosphoglycerate dehydrogenase